MEALKRHTWITLVLSAVAFLGIAMSAGASFFLEGVSNQSVSWQNKLTGAFMASLPVILVSAIILSLCAGAVIFTFMRDHEANTKKLRNIEEQARQQIKQYEADKERKNRFIAFMSHELRTPINGIVGAAAILENMDLTEDQQEMAQLILKSADTLSLQLTDILDLSKLEAGRLELNYEPFDLPEMVHDTCDLHGITAIGNGVDFEIDIAPECEALYLGDAMRLKQVLGNLVSNAVKFTEDGFVKISVTQSGVEDNLHDIIFCVEDSGIGIPEIALGKVFQPFDQASKAISKSYGGTGLGLSVCKSLIQLMNGTIQVSSSQGDGTAFTCRVPMQRVEIKPETEAEPSYPAMHQSISATVLIVDDHPAQRRITQLVLSPMGYSIQTAENGVEAVNLVKETYFDIILMDINMPEMNGLEATRQIRAWESEHDRKASKIITFSADTSEQASTKSFQVGADMHLMKPIAPPVMIEGITDLLTQTITREKVA